MNAIRVKPIDVSQSKSMTLIVEYGDKADITDYANWSGATLVKKKTNKKSQN